MQACRQRDRSGRFRKDASVVPCIALASLGRPNDVGRAVQQPHAKIVLQLVDRACGSRRRDAGRARCAGEAAGLHHGDKHGDELQAIRIVPRSGSVSWILRGFPIAIGSRTVAPFAQGGVNVGSYMRAVIVGEVLVFIGVVVADAQGLIPLTQTVALLPMCLLALWLQGQKLSTIGCSWPSNRIRAVGVGVVAGLAMELLALWITTPLISHLTGMEPDNSGLTPVRGNLSMLLLSLSLSWTLAAFGEELCFRGFLM